MKKLLPLLLALQLICLSASAKLYTITQEQKVRRGAGTKFDTYYKLNKGDTVELGEIEGKWARIIYKEKEGFVPAKMLQEVYEDDSVPVEKPEEDRDVYQDLDLMTIIELLAVIGVLYGIRKLYEAWRAKKRAKMEAEAPVIKPKPSYWFVCKHCGQKLRSTNRPSTGYCLKAPDHEWITLGLAGDINYHCKHCNMMVTTAKTPNEKDCSAGGSHTWTDLGPLGTKHYYCKECTITVMTTKEPTDMNCYHSERHVWTEL